MKPPPPVTMIRPVCIAASPEHLLLTQRVHADINAVPGEKYLFRIAHGEPSPLCSATCARNDERWNQTRNRLIRGDGLPGSRQWESANWMHGFTSEVTHRTENKNSLLRLSNSG